MAIKVDNLRVYKLESGDAYFLEVPYYRGDEYTGHLLIMDDHMNTIAGEPPPGSLVYTIPVDVFGAALHKTLSELHKEKTFEM